MKTDRKTRPVKGFSPVKIGSIEQVDGCDLRQAIHKDCCGEEQDITHIGPLSAAGACYDIVLSSETIEQRQ